MDPTQRFSDRVDYYLRARPKYPPALFRYLQDQLQLSPSQVVADIGSGTGFLTEWFVENGNVTYAVEPNREMRAAAEQHLGQWPNFRSIAAAAEATTLAAASVHWITAAQAFHWFKPLETRREFMRILKPGGLVALVWNERQQDATPFDRAYQQLIEEFQVDHTEVKRRSIHATDDATLKSFFGVGGYAANEFANPQTLDRDSFLQRILSSSYMPLPPSPQYERMLSQANALFALHSFQGTVCMAQVTSVYHGQLTGN